MSLCGAASEYGAAVMKLLFICRCLQCPQDDDLALAKTLQEQERAFMMLAGGPFYG